MQVDIMALNEAIKQESQFVDRALSEVNKIVVGQTEMLEGILMGLLTGGHVLLEGVPGLAKTLTISSVAQAISLDFQRVQFTPDLLPTDLIGTMIFNPKTGEFVPKKRSHLYKHCFGRRDQSGPCKSSKCSLGVYGGKASHHWRCHLQIGATVF